MGHYKSNLRDIEFNLFEVLGREKLLEHGQYEDFDLDTVRSILAEVDRMSRAELAESYEDSDRNPPVYDEQFAAFLLSMTEFGNTTGEYLERHGDQLVTTLDTLAPSTELLRRYSPAVPCFFRGVEHNGRLIRAVTGGPEFGGTHPNTHVTVSLLPGIPAYEYPENLPKTGVDTGPQCHGLPQVRGIPPYVNYDTGANPYRGPDETATLNPDLLALYLFGPLSPLGGGR